MSYVATETNDDRNVMFFLFFFFFFCLLYIRRKQRLSIASFFPFIFKVNLDNQRSIHSCSTFNFILFEVVARWCVYAWKHAHELVKKENKDHM